jgi:hypothetical protein
MLNRARIEPAVGMTVRVDLAGFTRYGFSIGRLPPARGKVVAVGPKGVTVKLEPAVAWLDTVTIERDRLVV